MPHPSRRFAVALGLGRVFGDEAAGRLGLAWALTAAMLGVSNALRAALRPSHLHDV